MTALPALMAPWAAFALALTTLSPGLPPSAGAPGPASRASTAQPPRAPATPQDPRLANWWSWPLSPQPAVVRPFLPPSSDYAQGHRGVDLQGRTGDDVLAVDAGTVTHVGVIAGRGTISVLHASGVRSTYEPVAAAVIVGQVVARGQRLGVLTVIESHCVPQACLHLGAVRDRVYLDPLTLLGSRRVRLLPMQAGP